ncbi:MAG: hypothetical protein KF777_17300 [Planctomycetaceae bacterium]|nr:hypothetical protein [Planctomycetaceae bacterium]
MSQTEPTRIERWATEIEGVSKKLHAHAKALLASGDDPFVQREQIERADKTLAETGLDSLKAPADIRKAIETACVEGIAEFWQKFDAAANNAGWEVHGSTERRLVARAFFVELKNDAVLIEAMPGKHSPHVPAVLAALKPHITSLSGDKASLQRFCDMLVEAYAVLGGQGDVSIEAIYRQCILLVQPAGFWANVEASKFQPLSRPIFRCRLAAVLAENVKPADGRELRLTPTVTRKDVWEVFSPAEGRVVQVGRLAFTKRGST